jgi:hypothetical protein
MSQNNRILVFFVFFFLVTPLFGQDDLLDMLKVEEVQDKKEFVSAAFKDIKVINAQSSETTPHRVLSFNIAHRFGNVGLASNGGAHTLWGFDHAANIRFSFYYGITERLQAGIGRSKLNEHLDGSLKYKLLRQTTDNSMPLSLTLYTNTAFTPKRDFEGVYSNVVHRFSYAHQLIVSKKFSEHLSLALLPTMLHRNIVVYEVNPISGAEETNDIYSIGFTGRLKVSRRTVLVADYFYILQPFRQNNPHYQNPLGIGVEIETGGHVFHINLSNAPGLIENDLLAYTHDSWRRGGYKFGFNISRVFHI